MPVCPKCGFSGQDLDACERCGVIYARMHTILEVQPALLAAVSAAKKSPPPDSSAEVVSPDASTLVDVPRPDIAGMQAKAVGRSIPAIAQAFPGAQPQPFSGAARTAEPTPGPGTAARPQREVTMVPIVPPQRKSRTLWPLVTILILCILGWGLMQWREHRARAYRPSDSGESALGTDYFDLRVAQIIEDCQSRLREVKDPAATKKEQEALWERVRRLKTLLVTSSLSDERKEAMDQVLDELVSFLKEDVGGALAAEKPATAAPSTPTGTTQVVATPGATGTALAPTPTTAAAVPQKPKRISRAALDRAADMLAHLPP